MAVTPDLICAVLQPERARRHKRHAAAAHSVCTLHCHCDQLSARWMAPESYFDSTWDLCSDVWMFGVLLWEVFSWAELPWAGVADAQIMPRLQAREKLAQPEHCPDALYAAMLECWRLDRSLRCDPATVEAALGNAAAAHALVLEGLQWPAGPTGSDRTRYAKEGILVDLDAAAALEQFGALETAPASIELIRVLGQGEFGCVQLANFHQTPTHAVPAAVKCVRDHVPPAEQAQFEYEARLLSALRHRNIVRVLAVCFTQAPNMLVLELMSGGDLQAHLAARAEALAGATDTLTRVCEQVCDAMVYLSDRRVVHRDLAARCPLCHCPAIALRRAGTCLLAPVLPW